MFTLKHPSTDKGDKLDFHLPESSETVGLIMQLHALKIGFITIINIIAFGETIPLKFWSKPHIRYRHHEIIPAQFRFYKLKELIL